MLARLAHPALLAGLLSIAALGAAYRVHASPASSCACGDCSCAAPCPCSSH